MRRVFHLIRVLALALLGATPASAQAPEPGSATFVVLLRGSQIGSERVTLSRTGNGWLLSSSGHLQAPIHLTTGQLDINYAADWQPIRFSLEAELRGQIFTLATVFGLTTATNDFMQGVQRGSNTQQVSPRSVVLPNNFYAAYEVLAARLSEATPGTRIPVYLAPEQEATVTVDSVTTRRITLPTGVAEVRELSLFLTGRNGSTPLEMWVDSRNRLVRLSRPISSLVVVRDDFASVMVREERFRNPGDEDVFIPSNGFSLAGTLTRPRTTPARAPVVVLVSGTGPQDRDYVSYGVPVVAQLAGPIADAGFMVVRYDSRGVGQSGGRTETAVLQDYSEDVSAVVEWLRKRKDVDADRIAVVAYAEGGPLAILAASRSDRIKALGLIATPGRAGRDVTMEQQEQVLALSGLSESERSARRTLQARLIEATLSGKGWEGIPPDVRDQANTPWFKSWLAFDPAVTVPKLEQPILVVHGARDTEVPQMHADALETLARGRKKSTPAATRRIVVAGANHLLVPSTTGDVREYMALPSKTISPEVGSGVAGWLRDVLPPR